MNKSSIVAAAGALAGSLLFLAAPLASARDNVSWSVNVGVPGVVYPAYAPVYAPPVVYARPAPIYIEPAPVYYNPPPVIYAPQPYYGRVYYDGYNRPYYWEHNRRMYGHGHGHGHDGQYRYGR